jgi:hypothetical protein
MDTNVMKSSLRKCLDAALLPAATIIVIASILQAIAVFMPSAADFLVLPVLIIDLIILAWAGYRAAKMQGMDFSGGVVTGAIAGVISGLVDGIINAVLTVLGVTGANTATDGTLVLAVAIILAIIASLLIGAVGGAVCGAVGARIAGMKK